MSHAIRTSAVSAAVLAATLLSAPSAHAAPSVNDCVNSYEWSHLQTDLDGPTGGARRSVVEQTWGVLPVGYRNQFWDPGNAALYGLAYNFCQNPAMLIVMVYRKTSGSWQIALKGEFLALPRAIR